MKDGCQHPALRGSAGIVPREQNLDEMLFDNGYLIDRLTQTANLVFQLVSLGRIPRRLHDIHPRVTKRVIAELLEIGVEAPQPDSAHDRCRSKNTVRDGSSALAVREKTLAE